ncbi:hypothetical protein Kisp01_69520 [Kineosporia sp. NBRC 101677]|nr:hypothetical protein Kisp01_69520 [Kineosporia sp. NBRC 101677]
MIGALIYQFPQLLPLFNEHLDDNEGEVLPSLVMADVVRWLTANVSKNPRECEEILAWLDMAYSHGSDEQRTVIAVSAVEEIPAPGEAGSELRGMLSPRLAENDPWA